MFGCQRDEALSRIAALEAVLRECRDAFAERALLGNVTRSAREMAELCTAVLATEEE
jgi:hypothetical protein